MFTEKSKTVSHRGGYKQRARCLKTIQTGKDTNMMRKINQSFFPRFQLCAQGNVRTRRYAPAVYRMHTITKQQCSSVGES